MIVENFLLAPHSPTTCVVLRYEDGGLREHGPPLEVRGRWFGSTAEDSMQVVVIDDDGRRLRLFELGEAAPREIEAPQLPVGVVADSVVLSDAVLFVGCHSDEKEAHLQREKLFALDLRATKSDWQPAPMWYDAEEFNHHKAIDELFVDGDRLLAIDDIVFPRYSLVYSIRERTQLELVKAVEMADHTSYESVRAATLGKRWLAVINAGVNHGTWSEFVSVLERESLAERICYSYSTDPFDGREPSTSGGLAYTSGLVFVGDVLMLAGGDAGLGIVDLRSYEPPTPEPSRYSFSVALPGPNIRYRSVEALASVDKVAGMRGRDLCVAIELNEQGPNRLRCVALSDDIIASW